MIKEVEKLTKLLTKKRNVQKFYSSYFAKLVMQNENFVPGLPSNSSTLLLSKAADLIVVHFKSRDLPNSDVEPVSMKENEIYGLQYIAGYVLHKLYNRLKAKRGDEEVIFAILSCKGSCNAYQDAKLISAVDRGGLWYPSEEIMKIFKIVELKFRYLVRIHQTTIDTDKFVQEMLNDMDICSIFRSIVRECEAKKASLTRRPR